jgi:hypothetical protein
MKNLIKKIIRKIKIYKWEIFELILFLIIGFILNIIFYVMLY